MGKIGLVGAVATAMFAAVIGVAGQSHEDDIVFGFCGPQVNYGYQYWYPRNNNPWMNQMAPSIEVPQVDTSVRN